MLQGTSNPVTANGGAGLDSQNQEMVIVVVNRCNLRSEILDEVAKIKGVSSINPEELSPVDRVLIDVMLTPDKRWFVYDWDSDDCYFLWDHYGRRYNFAGEEDGLPRHLVKFANEFLEGHCAPDNACDLGFDENRKPIVGTTHFKLVPKGVSFMLVMNSRPGPLDERLVLLSDLEIFTT